MGGSPKQDHPSDPPVFLFFQRIRGAIRSVTEFAAGSSVEASTERRLRELGEVDNPLGQVALVLARSLDEGAGMAAAAISKELRATLKELTPSDGGDDFQKLMDELSATVRHP